ncbi:MAG: DUF2911 domain-containing protein [Saprospiraceae bacterium]
MKNLLLVCGLVAASFSLQAQIKTPAPSPVCKMNQEVGLIKVDIEYSRPSARGRKVFGDVVQFGEMWRTGANASTKVTFSDEVIVGNDQKLPGKQYALYTIPGAAEWTIIFYKETKFWGIPGEDYKDEDVAAKFTVPVKSLKDPVETFTINLDNVRNSSADIVLTWENTKIVIPFRIDTDTKVMADIKAQMEGPSASTYYQAARYYFEEKKDMKQALEWVTKSLEKGGDKFWILQLKAKIQGELGKYSDAIATAQKSSELAMKENNTDYPRANDKLIAEWKKKM